MSATTLPDAPSSIAPGAAASQLERLGFLLVSGLPSDSGDGTLLVALRQTPTRLHFDPELVRYWVTDGDGRGQPSEVSLHSLLPVHGTFSWGRIELEDRFGIANTFVTVGGTISVERVTDALAVAVLHSPAPILRLGGHSQAVESIASELGAFFGRLLVPIDFQPGAEQAVSAAEPLDRYAAFVAFEHARYQSHAELRGQQPDQATILFYEAQRLRLRHPQAWESGRSLLSRLQLAA